MIIVQQGSVDPSGLSGTERDVYDQKMASSENFYYRTADELLFELKLRAAIVKAARDLQASGPAFASFSKSRANPRYWDRTEEGGFRLKPNVSPSDAIRDIYSNSSAYGFECATAIIIVLYKAVLETIGDDLFDQLFGNLYLYSWEHDTDMPITTVKGNHPSFPGDILYYSNPDHDPSKPQWQGENVVKLPGNKLYGHGIGITNEEGIIRELNANRKRGSRKSAYLLDQVTSPNYSDIMFETRSDSRWSNV
ncbi:MAG: protein-glutamine gamma-glutamyltransferase, partial [Paenibacillus sp.]|nr:protein-glutamine gamma-glutamyltransferase [Paenibacillus sp.]